MKDDVEAVADPYVEGLASVLAAEGFRGAAEFMLAGNLDDSDQAALAKLRELFVPRTEHEALNARRDAEIVAWVRSLPDDTKPWYIASSIERGEVGK